MNLFARALGGIFSDKAGRHYGMRGKGLFLAGALVLEGIGLILFGLAGSLPLAICLMLFFALFLKMANGATFGIVPFVNEKNVGLVSGIVGAGGNLGGVLFGFLFKSASISYAQAFQYIGWTVIGVALVVMVTRFAVKAPLQKGRAAEPQNVNADPELAVG
jgi:NNP family nitrate/nitrite transporter-like MFS transporter